MEDDANTPDPFETVAVLRSDLELQNRAMGLACEDINRIATALGCVIGELSPAEVVDELILPTIRMLRATQRHVDQATSELKERAARHGNKTIELENGVKGVLVGKKDPTLLGGLAPLTRRERREWDRKHR